jgi:hypothetical protein
LGKLSPRDVTQGAEACPNTGKEHGAESYKQRKQSKELGAERHKQEVVLFSGSRYFKEECNMITIFIKHLRK